MSRATALAASVSRRFSHAAPTLDCVPTGKETAVASRTASAVFRRVQMVTTVDADCARLRAFDPETADDAFNNCGPLKLVRPSAEPQPGTRKTPFNWAFRDCSTR